MIEVLIATLVFASADSDIRLPIQPPMFRIITNGAQFGDCAHIETLATSKQMDVFGAVDTRPTGQTVAVTSGINAGITRLSFLGELRQELSTRTTRFSPNFTWNLPRLRLTLGVDMPSAQPENTATLVSLQQHLRAFDFYVNASWSKLGGTVAAGVQGRVGRTNIRGSATWASANAKNTFVTLGAGFGRVNLDLSALLSDKPTATLALSVALN